MTVNRTVNPFVNRRVHAQGHVFTGEIRLVNRVNPKSVKEYWVANRGPQQGDRASGAYIGEKGSHGSQMLGDASNAIVLNVLHVNPSVHDPHTWVRHPHGCDGAVGDALGPSPSIAVGGSAEPRSFPVWGIFQIGRTPVGKMTVGNPPERNEQ